MCVCVCVCDEETITPGLSSISGDTWRSLLQEGEHSLLVSLLVCLDWSASLPQLGYVRINLAEFAGAGAVQRKYLLESYNEHKHKPDNSILRVKVTLRQTSGDVLFKA